MMDSSEKQLEERNKPARLMVNMKAAAKPGIVLVAYETPDGSYTVNGVTGLTRKRILALAGRVNAAIVWVAYHEPGK